MREMIEGLECRKFLSGTAFTVEPGAPGDYEVHGSALSDSINVMIHTDTMQATVTFKNAGIPQTVGNVNYIMVNGYAGDDYITISFGGSNLGGYAGAIALGHDGNDIMSIKGNNVGSGGLFGGMGDDSLAVSNAYMSQMEGGYGNDTLYISGESYDSYVIGGEGNDRLDARDAQCYTTMYGGAGNDTLYGSTYRDVLYGDDGFDVAYTYGDFMGFGYDETYGCEFVQYAPFATISG